MKLDKITQNNSIGSLVAKLLVMIVIFIASLTNGTTLIIGVGLLIGSILVRGTSLKRVVFFLCYWCLIIGGFLSGCIYFVSGIGLMKILIYIVLSVLCAGAISLIIGCCLARFLYFANFVRWLYWF